MIFSQDTMAVGGKVVIPHSFVNNVDHGEIVTVTHGGIHVIWWKGTTKEQKGYFSFAWLNQEYGKEELSEDAQKDCPLPFNDKIPF